jgi:hypothetical protein
MALSKIKFQPGIIKETTNYTASGGWYDCDKIRFRAGMPEKIGGWASIVRQPFLGTCRYLHQWSNIEGNAQYLALGTSAKLYILWSQSFSDITPIKATVPSVGPFCAMGAGSNLMYVHAPSNLAAVGDFFRISGVDEGFDIFTPDLLNQEFQVVGFYGDNRDYLLFVAPAQTESPTVVCGGGTNGVATVFISPGLDDAVIGQGWGIPPWGGFNLLNPSVSTGWGQAFDPTQLNPVDPTVNQLRLWSIDNFGEDMVAAIRGGPIYYWHEALGLSSHALPLTQPVNVGGVDFIPDAVPLTALQVLVSPNDRHLIAFGCEDYGQTVPNPLLVRWSDEENAYSWTPLRTNSAGSKPLSAGSFIICALRTVSGQILIWTDLGLWLMQYIGMPYVFGFQPIAQGLSIIGPNAMVNAAGNVYWMDHGNFGIYSGGVQELPCAVKDYVFGNLNYGQGYKVYAGHNHAFGEVYWFYPSAASMENDSYVFYNYVEQVWSVGRLERTAWLEMGRGRFPVATDRQNHLVYYHEFGDDDNGAPLAAWIDSADIDAAGGDHYMYLQRFVPDVYFRGAAGTNQSLGVTIFGRSEPLKQKTTWAQLQVTPMTGQQFIRVRDRQISFRFQSDGRGTGWRLGTIRADWQPDGRR